MLRRARSISRRDFQTRSNLHMQEKSVKDRGEKKRELPTIPLKLTLVDKNKFSRVAQLLPHSQPCSQSVRSVSAQCQLNSFNGWSFSCCFGSLQGLVPFSLLFFHLSADPEEEFKLFYSPFFSTSLFFFCLLLLLPFGLVPPSLFMWRSLFLECLGSCSLDREWYIWAV